MTVAAPAAAHAALPRTFFGTMVNGPLDTAATFASEAPAMRGSGLGSVRIPFNWAQMQPSQGTAPDFATMDGRVETAARSGLDVLALVLDSPHWAAEDPKRVLSTPKGTASYTAFARALIARYGSSGTFWAEHPDVPRQPVTHWQIWNEPNIEHYWSAQPFAKPYKTLLCAAYKAVHAADPAAKVVMAGLANYSWRAMASLEKAGVHGCFDIAAVHPFSGRPSNSLKITRLNRAALDKGGDKAKPIWLTELTWSSAEGKTKNTHGWETTEKGQADRLKTAYTLYAQQAKKLKLERIFWYTWVTVDRDSPNSFDWSGLRTQRADGTVADKPAIKALRAIIKKYG